MRIGYQVKSGDWQLSFTVPEPMMRDIAQTMNSAPVPPTTSSFLRELVKRGLLSWKQEAYRDNRPADNRAADHK